MAAHATGAPTSSACSVSCCSLKRMSRCWTAFSHRSVWGCLVLALGSAEEGCGLNVAMMWPVCRHSSVCQLLDVQPIIAQANCLTFPNVGKAAAGWKV